MTDPRIRPIAVVLIGERFAPVDEKYRVPLSRPRLDARHVVVVLDDAVRMRRLDGAVRVVHLLVERDAFQGADARAVR